MVCIPRPLRETQKVQSLIHNKHTENLFNFAVKCSLLSLQES
jgi:hypothetical protein